MKSITAITVVFILVIGLPGSMAMAKDVDVLLQKGLYVEQTKGDLDAAIKIYEQIIDDASAQRPHIAQAMYRLGMCYVKKQNQQRAKALFEELVTRFPEQTSIIEKIQPLLDEMSSLDPAFLMPPDTKIYIEFGSPGRQIETILNLLKGTPFANPLAVLGGGGGQGQKSPGNIMAALLNPSMIAEFKKMRGMAIGVTGIRRNNPPMIAVLYPGKSDALRGIILAGLSVAGQPGEQIEQMQTLIIGNNAAVAYDDEVFIIVQDTKPLERLNRCVKQYKGVTQEVSLTSRNKLFGKIGRKSRQDNVVTIWVDGAALFAAVSKEMGGGGQAAELRVVDGLVDFESLEDIVVQLSISESDIAIEANVGLKQEHRCLAYDLIRTPNLSGAGFEAVPSESIAVATLALGEPESVLAAAAQEKIMKLTGLNIGREIFANIEQITFFALPPSPDSGESVLAEQISPVLPRLGVAVTSHNPQQSRQFIAQLLTVAGLMTGASETEQSAQPTSPADNKYIVYSDDNNPVYCYMGQAGKSTVLALSPEVLEASMSAVKNRRSVLTTGPLHKALSQLSPHTSKLVLVNIGGAVRCADAHINRLVDSDQESQDNSLSQLFSQLAQACDNTDVVIRTDETANSFKLDARIRHVPPLGAMFPLVAQLAQVMPKAKVQGGVEVKGKPAVKVQPPTMPQPADGAVASRIAEPKLEWAQAEDATAYKVYFGDKNDALSLVGEVENTSYAKLPTLETDTTYYWRVDNVKSDGSVAAGDVWSFKTGKMIGWWKIDEGSGNIAHNSVEGGTDGQIHNLSAGLGDRGSVWGNDSDRGTVLSFNGYNNDGAYVSAGTIGPMDLTNGFTWAFWAKQLGDGTGDDGGDAMILGNRWGGTQSPLQFIKFTPKEVQYFYRGAPGGSDQGINYKDIPAGEWIHHVMVKDGAKLTYYRNRALCLVDTGTNPQKITTTIDGNPFTFGGDARGERWRGFIDDVRLYNYALSDEDVTALYTDTLGASPEKAEAPRSGR